MNTCLVPYLNLELVCESTQSSEYRKNFMVHEVICAGILKKGSVWLARVNSQIKGPHTCSFLTE
jgi:hypothetical protein